MSTSTKNSTKTKAVSVFMKTPFVFVEFVCSDEFCKSVFYQYVDDMNFEEMEIDFAIR